MAAFDKDPWKVLGLDPTATQVEIKRAYRRQALKYHPDINSLPEAKERWEDASRAYDILVDPDKLHRWKVSVASRAPENVEGATGQSCGQHRDGNEQHDPGQATADGSGGGTLRDFLGDLLEGFGREIAGRDGKRLLKDFVDFLEGSSQPRTGVSVPAWSGVRPAEELRFAREELETLRRLDKSITTEERSWAGRAEVARKAHRRASERQAMQKVFEARERRKSIRRRALQAEERVESLERAVFEAEANAKRAVDARPRAAVLADAPGSYMISRDGTEVCPTRVPSNVVAATLDAGDRVQVVEVIVSPNLRLVRGRLENPVGWISIMNTETGERCAEPMGRGVAGLGGGPETGEMRIF